MLLEYCKTLFKSIIFTVFDRGFCIAELIDYPEANKRRYLIPVPEKKGKILQIFIYSVSFSSKRILGGL